MEDNKEKKGDLLNQLAIIADLTEKMNEASADAETLMNASKEIGTVIEEIDEKEFRWLELSERA